jgi:hypothetical protein
MKTKTHVKAGNNPIGSTGANHNETFVADTPRKRYCTAQRRRVSCSCPRES